ncbi:hypothetical protein [Micromonospora aurantiaca (nom. illeg.)]|uniref:hypothetical protein n=1 Tax=Micromonospora aurantiaca (nom. illeg.) TaxID=47850 RepID=UPI0008286DBB|nr:hypothetical protein [Micromonospora aurantiaca]SCL21270.1 hypothetical protein GA0070615_0030 [Micromonospora aurantiaca]SCL21404.1 hypothetical protein GA0070615_0064 [Micromonospora aurantiaca]
MLVETTRTGQVRLVTPPGARRRPVYPTGVQVPCVPCAAAGVDRQGLPRDGPDSDALCMSCWRGREQRQYRRAVAELVDAVDTSCAACGDPEPSPACWLCGYSWLAEQRAKFERDQAAEAAAVKQRFALLAEHTEAEARVADLAGWVDRLRATVESYAARGGRGRAVELLAELLARDAAARASRRGRPSMLARVAAVLAVDADYRTGRRALPGRDRAAEFAGCTVRAVTAAWARAEALGWATRTHQGGKLSLAERTELGRYNNRAEFDLVPLHHGDPAARAPYVPLALLVLDDLLQHALALLAAAEDDVDALIARTGAVVDHAGLVRRAQLRVAVATARETLLADVETIATRQIETGNFFPPRSASPGKRSTSCLSRGFTHSPELSHSSRVNRTSRREERASRSPMRSADAAGRVCEGSHSLRRPRTPYAERRPTHRAPQWAYDLARALTPRWAWLREAKLPRVAATLGAALSDEWTAEAVDGWVRRTRGGRGLLAAPDNPCGYLKHVLEEALTGPAAPPHPARRHAEHRRAMVAARAAEQREHQDAARADQEDRDWTATRAGRRSPDTEAALAAIRSRTSGRLRRADRAALLDDPVAGGGEWPEVAQPGAGLPPGLAP